VLEYQIYPPLILLDEFIHIVYGIVSSSNSNHRLSHHHHQYSNNHRDSNTNVLTKLVRKEMAICSVIIAITLMMSIFTTTNSLFGTVYGITAGKRAQQDTPIPPELAASTVNSGNPPITSNFNITKGYVIKPVLWNLTLPSSVAFDGKGNMFVGEAGLGFGGLASTARILKINTNGTISTLTDRFLSAPITSIVYHQGKLYVANKGKISTVNPLNGAVADIITDLPAGGDHPTNQIAFGSDGRMYFSQGSATNSGVVGEDNYSPNLGWLSSFPFVHDVPGKNITLTGQNFPTPNLLADGPKKTIAIKDYMTKISTTSIQKGVSSGKGTGAVSGNVTGNVTTGAFVAFGNTTRKGEIINGNVRCSGCIISAKPDGTDLKLVAWGMRLDAFTGLVFDKSGKHLIITDPGSEERGSRPIKGDDDKVWSIDISDQKNLGKWYGWPDYFGGKNKELKPVTDPQFRSPRGGQKPLQFLMQNHPGPIPKLFADAGYAVKLTSAALSNPSGSFGFGGMAFIGEYGTHAPFTHQFGGKIKEYVPGNTNKTIIGQKIIKLDTTTGNFSNFISLKSPDPSFRPVGLSFSPDGAALYIMSLGKSEYRKVLPSGESLPIPIIWMYPSTGVIWKVTRSSAAGAAAASVSEPPPAKLSLSPELTVTANSGPVPTSNHLRLPPGYKIEPVLWNLNIPGSIAFDDKQNMYVGDVGFAYVGLEPPPRILKVDHQSGNVSVFVDRGLDRPLTAITFHNGQLYVANGGKISTVDMKGMPRTIIPALPGIGDHYVDQIVFAPDDRMYFDVGTATNSGVVGKDNPWAKSMPEFHDIPGKDIKLAGVNFNTRNFLQAPFDKNATTGAYVPFGIKTKEGQTIKGDIKCTGCILSAKDDGTDVKLVGWGFRHAYGLGVAPDGKLVVSMNAADERGSRNIANDGDKIYVIDISNPKNFGKFYGWPDYFGYAQPVTDPQFRSPLNNQSLTPLIQNDPPAEKPSLVVDVGAALTHIAISNSSKFGFKGMAFIGEFGTLAPQTHLTANSRFGISVGSVMGQIIGQRVIVFDPKTMQARDFLTLNTADGNFRPTGLAFSPDGNTLYIASVGLNEVRTVAPSGAVVPYPLGLPWAFERTGIIWKVTHS
jgi:glucose/arabinose dehydrogenase